MTAQSLERLLTPRDLVNLPDDGKRYELHQGELVAVGISSRKHSKLGAWLVMTLLLFIERQSLGGDVTGADGTFQLTAFDTSVPDAAYVSAAKTAALPRDTVFYPFAPDLTIEIKSPSQSKRDMQLLPVLYINAGSRLVWCIDTKAENVTVYRANGEHFTLSREDRLDGEDVLPGFTVELEQLFAVIDGI